MKSCCKRTASLPKICNIRRYSNYGSKGNMSKCPFVGKTSQITSTSTFCPIIGKTSNVIRPSQKKAFSVNPDIINNPLHPQRDGLDDNEFVGGIKWRENEPFDYNHLNERYLQERIAEWKDPSSLEQIVSNLVKTFEMELTNKPDPNQWVSMATDVFRYKANDGPFVETEEAVEKGSYNILLNQADPKLYDTSMSFEQSHETFFNAFPDGFMWEVLKVYAGPPKVAFSWRHWGTFEGVFNNNKGDNKVINMYGFATAKVRMPNDKDPRIRIEEVEVWYDMNKFLAELNGIASNAIRDVAFGM